MRLLLTLVPVCFLLSISSALAQRATTLTQPLDAYGTSGLPGDYLLENERISVVISAPYHPDGKGASGGYIIDAFPNDHDHRRDHLHSLVLRLNRQFLHMARYDQVRIAYDGQFGLAAVEARGTDSGDPNTEIITTYSIQPNSNAVQITTRVTPHGHGLDNYWIGDALGITQGKWTLPGASVVDDKVDTSSLSLGSVGHGVAYQLVGENRLTVTGGLDRFLQGDAAPMNLQPEQTFEYRRSFTVEAIPEPKQPGARVELQVADSRSREPLPSRAIFSGINGTHDPVFGGDNEAPGANSWFLPQGHDTVLIAPGDYSIAFCRGIEYDALTTTVHLTKSDNPPIAVALTNRVHPDGWIAGDLHLHTLNSFDCGVPVEDRVISCACEGLDFAVATDHNHITDYSRIATKLGLDKWLLTITGVEVTTHQPDWGHFNGFPLTPDYSKPHNGALPDMKTNPSAIFDGLSRWAGEQVIQANHPSQKRIGYFQNVGLTDGTTSSAQWSDKFTAIEVLNGKRSAKSFDAPAHDWFALLNRGYKYTGTGGSDSHLVTGQLPGYPRTYVRTEQRHPEIIAQTINQKHAVFVTNGPIVSFRTAAGTEIGGTETTTGTVTFDARVSGANFVQPSSIELWRNGERMKSVPFAETEQPVKWRGKFSDTPTTNSWYLLVVHGKKSLAPVAPQEEPIALTNPIWVNTEAHK